MKVAYKTIIDLAKQPEIKFEFIKGDTATRTAYFTITQNGTAYDMSDVIDVSIKVILPDGTVIYSPCDSIEEDGTVVYTFSSEITKVAGKSAMQLIITDSNSGQVSASNIFLIVKDNIFDGAAYVTSDDLSTIQAYLARALAAATSSEDIKTAIENVYGALSELSDNFETEYEEYVAYLQRLQAMVDSGAFNGAQGQPGTNGADAVVTETEGAGYGFQIVDGNLIIYYWTEDEPNFTLTDDGELVFSYGEDE